MIYNRPLNGFRNSKWERIKREREYSVDPHGRKRVVNRSLGFQTKGALLSRRSQSFGLSSAAWSDSSLVVHWRVIEFFQFLLQVALLVLQLVHSLPELVDQRFLW